MASVAGLTLREAILPLKASFDPTTLRTTKVENSWTSNNVDHYYKMYLPVCSDVTNKEILLYVIDQFVDAAHNDRLHLSTGDSRYSKFRQVLDGSLRLDWQTISDARNNKTINSFTEDVHALINLYLSPTSREDQLAYLRNITKPFLVEVAEASARLTVISRLGRWLPGSWTAADHNVMQSLFADDDAKKRQLFQLMPMPWRIEFAKSARQLEDPNLTYAQLTQFFSLQEAIEKQQRSKKRPASDISASGGRGRGRGGRGGGRHGGRGYGGRGFGRGYSQPYRYGSNNYNQGAYVQRSPNPYIAGAQGGRIPQAPRTPRAGYQSPRPIGGRQQPVPRVSHSPRRQFVRGGRGPPPQFPQFMADQYNVDDQVSSSQDQYYQTEGQEAFYGGDYYGGEQDQYYGGDEQYYGGEEQGQDYDQNTDDQYYEDQGNEDQGGHAEGTEDHFLQDFGY